MTRVTAKFWLFVYMYTAARPMWARHVPCGHDTGDSKKGPHRNDWWLGEGKGGKVIPPVRDAGPVVGWFNGGLVRASSKQGQGWAKMAGSSFCARNVFFCCCCPLMNDVFDEVGRKRKTMIKRK